MTFQPFGPEAGSPRTSRACIGNVQARLSCAAGYPEAEAADEEKVDRRRASRLWGWPPVISAKKFLPGCARLRTDATWA